MKLEAAERFERCLKALVRIVAPELKFSGGRTASLCLGALLLVLDAAREAR